jgi:hypothetical protein
MQSAVRAVTLGALMALAQPATAQMALPLKRAPEATTPAITPADLMSRMYLYADDSMMGRAAGSAYNLKATAYIAAEARRLGLQPAGDSGGYFQNVPMIQRALDPNARITVDGTELRMGEEYMPRDQSVVTRSIDGVQVVYGGAWGDIVMLPAEAAAGKLVVLGLPKNPDPQVPSWFVPRAGAIQRFRSAAGIAIVSLDAMPPQFTQSLATPQVTLKDDATPAPAAGAAPLPSYLYLSRAAAERLIGVHLDSAKSGTVGKTVRGGFAFVETPAPARNVVAVLRGSDPALRGQYVAIGAHNDHVGFDNNPVDHDSLRAYNDAVRKLEVASPTHQVTAEQRAQIRVNVDSLRRVRPARPDSIYNGADDDGSGTVSVLEIAEAFAGARAKPKRSIIFVWHTAEELGLFGAQYFTDHPTVPRDSIVAQLNMDMVGRGRADDEAGGGPGYLQLIGSRRLSTELGTLVESVNTSRRQPFTFDYQYDAAGHPEQFYCRSDHYMYARYGIPIVFLSTGGHRDYHQVTDEPQYIDYEKMANVSQFVHDLAIAVANLDHRVVVDKPKPDPRGNCVQ